MQYLSNKGLTGWAQIGLILLLTGVGLIIGGIVQMAMAFAMLPEGTSLLSLTDELLKAMKNPQNVSLLRWMQFISTFLLFFVPAYIFSRVANGKEWIWMGFSKYINLHQVMLGFLIIFTANMLGSPLQQLSEMIVSFSPSLKQAALHMEQLYNDQVLAMAHISGSGEFILVLIIMAFFPALFEELFFRGILQNVLVKWWKQPLLAIIITSLLFSLIHASIYLFLTRALLGFVLGWMYFKTRNLWVNIVAHFINNALAATQMFVMSQKGEKIDVSKMDMPVEWWQALIAAGVLYFLFHLLEKYSSVNRMRIINCEEAMKVNYPQGQPLAD